VRAKVGQIKKSDNKKKNKNISAVFLKKGKVQVEKDSRKW